jgi:AbrB family looped-hinge helix DNA binding protein
MTIIEMAKITSKGQVTIPNQVRKILHLEEGSTVIFGLGKEGIMLLSCKVVPESPYTPKEWEKIKNIISEKSRVYKTAKEAKKHINGIC